MRTTTRTWVGALAIAVGVAGGLGACGDDDDSGTTGDETPVAAENDITAACAASVQIDENAGALPQPEGDEPTEADLQAVRDAFGPLGAALDDLEAALPDAPAAVTDAVAMVREVGETGVADFDPEIVNAVNGYFYDVCQDDQLLGVTAADYRYDGFDAPDSSAPYRIRIQNEGTELHEAVVFRKAPGETRSVEELLALPEEEAMSAITFENAGFAAPGGEGYLVGEAMEPGDYVMVCFIPVGTTSFEQMEGPEGAEAGPPHFTQGMIQEFRVE